MGGVLEGVVIGVIGRKFYWLGVVVGSGSVVR